MIEPGVRQKWETKWPRIEIRQANAKGKKYLACFRDLAIVRDFIRTSDF
jgi:hypothetical protein